MNNDTPEAARQHAAAIYWDILCDMTPERQRMFTHWRYGTIERTGHRLRTFLIDGDGMFYNLLAEEKFMFLCFVVELLSSEE